MSVNPAHLPTQKQVVQPLYAEQTGCTVTLANGTRVENMEALLPFELVHKTESKINLEQAAYNEQPL